VLAGHRIQTSRKRKRKYIQLTSYPSEITLTNINLNFLSSNPNKRQKKTQSPAPVEHNNDPQDMPEEPIQQLPGEPAKQQVEPPEAAEKDGAPLEAEQPQEQQQNVQPEQEDTPEPARTFMGHVDVDPEPVVEEGDVDEKYDDLPAFTIPPKDVGVIGPYLEATIVELKRQLDEKEGPFYTQVVERGDMWHRPPDPSPIIWNKIIKEQAIATTINPDMYYHPEICVWDPQLMYPGFKVNCIKCKREASQNGWSSPRRVIGLHRNYYLLFRRYDCKSCKLDFRPSTSGFLNTLPRHIQHSFPATLTKRSAIDQTIVDMLDSFVDGGMPSQTIASTLSENHRRHHSVLWRNYLSVIVDAHDYAKMQIRKNGPFDSTKVGRFSAFDDPKGYNGFAPSGKIEGDLFFIF
jgi:hypothetical protein